MQPESIVQPPSTGVPAMHFVHVDEFVQSSQSARQLLQVVSYGGIGRYSLSRHTQEPFLTIGTKNRPTSHEVHEIDPKLSSAVEHPFTEVQSWSTR